MEITLFERFILWLSRNKKTFTIDVDAYNNRIYKVGSFVFTELSKDIVMMFGKEVSYKADSLVELVRFVSGIKE